MPDIDNLSIKISADAKNATSAIDNLTVKLTALKGALNIQNTSGLYALSAGLKQLGNAMQVLSAYKMPDFTRVVKGIDKLSTVNSANINVASASIQNLGTAMSGFSNLSSGAKQLTEFTTAIAKLGNKGVINSINNMPKLASSFNNLMASLSKAPKVSRNVIDLANAMANLSKSGASIGTLTTRSATGLNLFSTAAKRAKVSSAGLAAVIGKIYASYWLLFRLFSKLGDAISISSSITELQNVINMTFGESQDKINDFLDDSVKKFGMSELAVKQYAARFQALGTAMAISSKSISKANSFLQSNAVDGYVAMSDDLGDVSLTLTKLTADIASFYDVAQSDVAEDLQAIFTGMTKPLRKYGLDLTQATLKEFALKNGLDADIASMSQAEKTMLRYQYVLANTTQLQGDFERTSKTWHNQVTILKAGFEQLANIVGTILINAFKGLLITVNEAMTGVITAMQNVLNALGEIFGWTVEVNMGGLVNDSEDYADSLDDASGSAKKLKNNLLGIDELNIISDSSSSSGSDTSTSSTADTSSIISVIDTGESKYESWIKNLEQLGSAIGDKLASIMNDIDWDKAFQGAKDFGKGLADFLNGLISPSLFKALGKTIANSINTAIKASISFAENFDWEDFGLSIATGVNSFFETFDFGSLAHSMNAWAQGLWSAFKETIENLDWKAVLSGIKDFLTELDIETIELIVGTIVIKQAAGVVFGTTFLLEAGKKIATGLGAAISTFWFATIVPKLMPAIAASFSGIAVKDAFSAAFGSIPTFFTGLISVIGGAYLAVKNFIDMWNEGFSWINELLMVLGITLAGIGAALLGAPALIVTIVAGIVAAVGTLVTVIHENWDAIYTYIYTKFEDIKARFYSFMNLIQTKVTAIITSVKTMLGTMVTFIKTSIVDKLSSMFDTVFSHVADVAKTCVNSIISFFESMINKVVGAVNQFFGLINSAISMVNTIANTSFDPINLIETISIPRFATGGYPETGSLFFAGEAGAEIVGSVNGKTGVVSNDEITGITQAIYESGNAESTLLSQAVSLLSTIASKDMSLEIDGRELATAISNRTSRNGYAFGHS